MDFEITKRQTRTRKRVRSYCSSCGKPLFEGEPATWKTNPMGLSHEECPS